MLRVISIVIAVFLSASTAMAAELKIKDLKTGTGDEATRGATVSVHYTGWLLDGTKFDSSLDRKQPFQFIPGAGMVIRGWEEGVVGMKVGGKRELIIPPELGYGKRGAGAVIPPNATLKFEIELLAVKQPKYKNITNSELKDKLKKGTKILDLRRPEEWKKTGVVEGSILMTLWDKSLKPNPSFVEKFKKLVGKKDEIILICRTGNRTQHASRILSGQLGFEGISNVTRGITHWIKKGNPVSKAVMPKDCWLCQK